MVVNFKSLLLNQTSCLILSKENIAKDEIVYYIPMTMTQSKLRFSKITDQKTSVLQYRMAYFYPSKTDKEYLQKSSYCSYEE